MKNLLLLSALLGLFLAQGCKKNNEDEVPMEPEPVRSGMIVACEGSFGQNNASVHWLGDDGSFRNNVYQSANGSGPGDVLQNLRCFNDRLYLVVNNSQKVEVVNGSNFSSIATISGCDYPRDVYVVNGQKGYISNGNLEGELLVFNPNSNTISGSIEVGFGPEEITANSAYVFVANSGGWGSDNRVSVINPVNDQVLTHVTVGDRPVALQTDYQGNVWVLCAGAITYDENWNIVDETPAELMRIDGQSHVVTASVQVGEVGDHPSQMAINGNETMLFVANGELLSFDIANGTWNPSPVSGDNFASVGVHPISGEFILSGSPDYVSNDDIFVYSADGALLRSSAVGIAPRAFVFKENE